MKNFKKVLALVLSLAMIISTFTVSFAAEKTDAEICEALGMLQGEGNGVTDEYLAKSTTRFQAALMFLRLQGLEDEALAFEGTETFEDAEDLQWVAGRAVLAYLKANPELGWVGTGKGFMPNAPITAQAYYKVMLEAIGYEYNVDFEWAEVLEFAATKGLEAAAEVEDFTNNDIAVVTVETLNAENSEGVVLINKLVEDGVIAAENAELIDAYVAPVTAKMTIAKAIDSTTIIVTFDEAVDVDADDFSVVAGDKEFAVSSVKSADAGTVAVLTVAELTVGDKYTVTSGEVSKTVVPTIKDDTTKPAISGAEAITGEVVTVSFGTRNINQDTLTAENFSLNNDATVLSVELDMDAMEKEENVGKTVVTLRVSGLKAGKAFVVKSTGVESYEGNIADTDDSKATFAGKDADTKAPALEAAASVAGYQVKVYFKEAVKLDEATATDISNYSISPELEITDAKIEKNIIGDTTGNNVVILTTAFQKSGTAYTLSVSNVSDGTNVMKDTEKKVFAGKEKADNQVANSAEAINATTVEVTFEYDCNETALDVVNYEMDNDVQVVSAVFKEDVDASDKLNQKVVVLTTTEMKSGKAYTLTVKTGVQDVLNQGLKDSKKLVFAGKDKDTSFTSSIKAKSEGKTTVKVTFGEPIDRASALEVSNYKISDLGYPSEVQLSSDGKVATLKVQEQQSGISYTITLNNLKDKSDNVIKADTKVTFTGIGDIVKDLRVTGAEALSKDKVKIMFNQKVKGSVTTTVDFTLANTTTSGETLTLEDTTTTVDANYDLHYIILNVNSTTKLNASSVYKVTMVDADKSLIGKVTSHTINHDYDEATFVGSDSAKAVFGVETTSIINKKYVKVTFEEKITGDGVATLSFFKKDDYTDAFTVDGTPVTATFSYVTDSGKSIVYMTNKDLASDSVYYVKITAVSLATNFKSATGQLKGYDDTTTTEARTSFVSGALGDSTKLVIDSASMLDANTLQLKFNVDADTSKISLPSATASGTMLDKEDVKLVTASDSTTAISGITIAKLTAIDSKTVNVYFSGVSSLTANSNDIYYVYIDGSLATDFTTKVGDESFDSGKNVQWFAKITNDNNKPAIVAVSPVTDNKVKVTLNEEAYKDLAETSLDADNFVIRNVNADVTLNGAPIVVEPGDVANKEFYVSVTNGKFLEGEMYRIGLKDAKDRSGQVTSDEYAPATNEESNSMEFGGSASAVAAPTVPVIDVSVDDQVTISWTAAANVAKYKVYHKEGDAASDVDTAAEIKEGVTPTVIIVPNVTTGVLPLTTNKYVNCVIVAVDELGNESAELVGTVVQEKQ